MKAWQKYLTPSQLGKVYVSAGVVAIFLVTWGVMSFLEPEKKVRTKPPEIKSVITDRNSRIFGLDAVNDKVVEQAKLIQDQDESISKLKEESEKLREQVAEANRLTQNNRALEKQMENFKKELGTLRAQQKEYQVQSRKEIEGARTANQQNNNSQDVLHPDLKVDPERRRVAGSSFSYGNTAASNDGYSRNQTNTTSSNHVDRRTGGLISIIENKEKTALAQEQSPIYLPKGSILTGVLITGLDAPTAARATDNPVPVLVRIKKEAILPNFAVVQEVDECFALMAGYGDLSSERAMLRGESITCVRHDKSVIEADFSGFAVGEDGKNGLKGTLVTRNSTVLANAMMAGFGAGLASMFDVNPVPVIATNSNGQQQYQDVFSSDAVTGGAAKGASEAMTKLADYYMSLADSIHPIIEIGAGRVVDMVITQGATL